MKICCQRLLVLFYDVDNEWRSRKYCVWWTFLFNFLFSSFSLHISLYLKMLLARRRDINLLFVLVEQNLYDHTIHAPLNISYTSKSITNVCKEGCLFIGNYFCWTPTVECKIIGKFICSVILWCFGLILQDVSERRQWKWNIWEKKFHFTLTDIVQNYLTSFD